MNFLHKLKNFFYSWNYCDSKVAASTLLMGYQGKDLLKYFIIDKDNYICSISKRPFNIKILIPSMIIFLKTLFFKPKIFLRTLRWIHRIYFICGYIKVKKIKCIVSFSDYNEIPFFIKKILSGKILTIGLQNSRRENRTKHLNFDHYFLLFPVREEEKIDKNKKCKLNSFGSLRLMLALQNNNKWNYENIFLERNISSSEIVLISSATKDFLEFIQNNFKDKLDLHILNEEINKLSKKFHNSPKNYRQRRFLNYLTLCDYLFNYVKDSKDNLIIINRFEPDSNEYLKEKLFYNNFFSNKLSKFSKNEKYNYLLSKKDKIVASDISTLSRECLSINMKCIFFNNYVKYVKNYWTNNDAIFYSSNEKKKDFNLRLDKLKLLNKKNFMIEKKKVKKISYAIEPLKTNLIKFLKIANLQLR